MVADPEFKAGALKAVSAYYNALSSEARDTSTAVDSDRLRQSIESVYGPIVDIAFFGTNEVFSFKDQTTGDFVAEDDLYDMFNSLDDGMLTKALGKLPTGALGETVTADDIKENGRIISAGDGLYNVSFDDTGILMGDDGSPVEIDGRRLLDIYRKGAK